MVKVAAFILFLLATLGLIYFQKTTNYQVVGKKEQIVTPSPKPSPTPTLVKKSSIFVPYWADFSGGVDVSDYDTAIYFGITPSRSGTIVRDTGYNNIEDFKTVTSGKQQLLTVRMLDSDTNMQILKDGKAATKTIEEVMKVVEEYGFDGVVLDLEMSVLPFQDTTDMISAFMEKFSQAVKAENKHFAVTMYGDAYYRGRPYDIARIGSLVDEMMIMAYDFHKSRGEPGPNFPLSGKDKYGYDYTQLVTDFAVVPKEKLTVIFGMYGYDWAVDEKKKPIRPAKALSLQDITKEFISNCEWKNCVVFEDKVSGETEVNYVDKNLLYHVVWFEDVDSMLQKREFLEKHGIGSTSFWVYGYF